MRIASAFLALFLFVPAGRSQAFEIVPPDLTDTTLRGEWAGFAHVTAAQGFLVHLHVRRDAASTLSLAYGPAPEEVFIYSLSDMRVEKEGKVAASGHAVKWAGNFEKNVVIRIHGRGKALQESGTLEVEVTKQFKDREIRLKTILVKTPRPFLHRLSKMLTASQKASNLAMRGER